MFNRKATTQPVLDAVATSTQVSCPSPRVVKVEGEKAEIAAYTELCEKVNARTPAVRLLELKHFMAERGIPEYDPGEVHRYLSNRCRQRDTGWVGDQPPTRYSYSWRPLRLVDKEVEYLWASSREREQRARINKTLYHELVPPAVLQTVGTIAEEFPDAHFFVSHIDTDPDPFLAVTFPGQHLVIVDFWNEPGFRPTK